MSRANQWFVPGDGIAREVITADIQRYLGPDALVRPGVGTGEYQVRISSPQHTALITDEQTGPIWLLDYRLPHSYIANDPGSQDGLTALATRTTARRYRTWR
jgi:hypothetical protein